ncbi:FHA domain-containing protein [Oculatella sp. LEGE 06141]|uniref:FHA domain-containing protein n=1 Tax=Oculatella sp. LEGE 06141 TaxID=1828648 RepID=UPI00187ED0BF|nr:FHA domain-containing protein [Oculatella sp. LEGE 06141]MBE9180896.1 FHA domain-containing protein [Oculatella sp. LEGE 06141]
MTLIALKLIDRHTGESQKVELKLDAIIQGQGLIGRHPNCDIVLSSPEVSRVHGRIVYQAGQYYYTDLGSTGGSLVNNKSVQTNQHLPIGLGDIIRIGKYSLLVQTVELDELPPPLAPTQLSVPDTQATSINPIQPSSLQVNAADHPSPVQQLVPKAANFIFSVEMLRTKGLLKQGSAELIFQGKELVEGLSLSKRLQQKAIALCQAELNLGKLCIVVEHDNHFTLWQEKDGW